MGLSKACFSSMLEYDNDGDESPMHIMHPLTPKPPKLGMLRFWHMEWGKEKRKFVFFDTYVLF